MVKKEEVNFEGDPIAAIDGILSDIDMDSVELQHKIKDIWILRVVKNVSD